MVMVSVLQLLHLFSRPLERPPKEAAEVLWFALTVVIATGVLMALR